MVCRVPDDVISLAPVPPGSPEWIEIFAPSAVTASTAAFFDAVVKLKSNP